MMDAQGPLPWSIDDDGDILDADGMFVSSPRRAGNRAFIITAVNAHAELLSAAKYVIEQADKGIMRNSDGTIARAARTKECWKSYDLLTAAIAKASE